jgi:3,4-dihydroxy 2-butanone 4-phosphate synthase/GTP cyclohydrolase II
MFTALRPLPKPPPAISPIEEAIADIKAGKMVILMDDESRENEGDVCMAAEKVTPEAINFMAKYARGLICLALSEERIRELGLSMMVSENRAPLGTAFTVSIDARHGIGTGVSAHDRAVTIQTAMRDDAGPEQFVTPGHVFPLRARRGGVLVRTGQTEGSVDLARLAGRKPGGVICEIMNEDGTMARLPQLQRFAATHGLKICTVADLIQYRLRCDSLVTRVATAQVPTRHGGVFTAYVYRSEVDDGEHLALVKGEIRPDEPVLVRAHAEYLIGDVFGSADRNTAEVLHRAMELVAAEGRGVILYLRRERQGAELREGARGRHAAVQRPSTDASQRAMDFREYGIGAQILRHLGVGKMRLITNYPRRLVSLPGYGLEVVECIPIRVPGPEARPRRPARPPARTVARQSAPLKSRATSKA